MADTQQQQQTPPATQEQKKPEWKAAPGMYKNIRGQAIIKADGTKMKQVNGHFDPKTAEEKELCAYFAERGMLSVVK